MAILSILNGDAVTQLSGTVVRAIAGSDEGRLAQASSPMIMLLDRGAF
jgi:hypothetical protein